MARAVMQEILPKDILRTDIRRNGGLGLDAIALEHLADGFLSVRQVRALLMPAIDMPALYRTLAMVLSFRRRYCPLST